MAFLPGWTGYPGASRLATVILIGMLGFTSGVGANDYGGFIQVESEEDLLDLLAAQEIEEDDYETLRELLEDGVDLNTADRDELYSLPNLTYADVDAILLYREETGYIDDPVAMVTAEVISARKLESIAPFILILKRDPALFDTRGRFRYLTTFVVRDEQVPSMVLSGKVSTFRNLDVGLAGVLTRNRLSGVNYDPNRFDPDNYNPAAHQLSANPPSVQVHLPKFYLQWKTKRWHLVGGTFRIGFGQRLTFDNTTLYNPNGIRVDDTISYNQDLSLACRESAGELDDSPCEGVLGDEYQSPDYRWTDRFRGAAVGLKSAPIGSGWLQAYGFFSYQTRSIYQYEIYDRGVCDDPLLDDDNPDCAALLVFRPQDDPLESTSTFKLSTLPDMFNEMLGGGNLAYFFDRRTHVGVTGYGAGIDWLVQGVDLDFQEWSRLPYGGPFGAVGVDAAWGYDLVDLFFEFARTFDGQPAGGGYAAILRSTFTWKKHEFEGIARYYDKDFANPYARPVSAADEYDGLRARDEAGLRMRYTGTMGDWQLRSTADFWVQPSEQTPKMSFKTRATYELTDWFHPGVWFEFQDKDLSASGRGACFQTPIVVEGEPVPCTGEKVQVGVQARFRPLRDLSITAKYQHRWLDEKTSLERQKYASDFRQDMAGWLIIAYQPIEELRLRARVRYLFEALTYNDFLEQSLWFYLEAAYWYQRDFRVKLRYEMYSWLDDRDSTQDRYPNPAHWLRLELEYRF